MSHRHILSTLVHTISRHPFTGNVDCDPRRHHRCGSLLLFLGVDRVHLHQRRHAAQQRHHHHHPFGHWATRVQRSGQPWQIGYHLHRLRFNPHIDSLRRHVAFKPTELWPWLENTCFWRGISCASPRPFAIWPLLLLEHVLRLRRYSGRGVALEHVSSQPYTPHKNSKRMLW